MSSDLLKGLGRLGVTFLALVAITPALADFTGPVVSVLNGDLPSQVAPLWRVGNPVHKLRGNGRLFEVTRGHYITLTIPSVHTVFCMFSKRWRGVVFAVC